jgi:hypothetical protein
MEYIEHHDLQDLLDAPHCPITPPPLDDTVLPPPNVPLELTSRRGPCMASPDSTDGRFEDAFMKIFGVPDGR